MKKIFGALTNSAVAMLCLLSIQLPGQNYEMPYGMRPFKWEKLEEVIRQIDASRYDSAEAIITTQLIDKDERLNAYELYFFHCIEAEIMYYNALYDQGIVSALKAIELSEELKNDTLTGNAFNLAGLQFLEAGQYTKAKKYFKAALLLLPGSSKNLLYSQSYQAFANLAELYLYEENADSAIYYSNLAVAAAHKYGTSRGEAFGYWSLAEGELIANRPLNARAAIELANAVMIGIEEEDVSLYLAITSAKIYSAIGKPDSTQYFIDYGLSMLNSTGETDQAKLSFLEFLTDFSIKNNDLKNGYSALSKLNETRNRIYFRQNELRLNLMNNFYRGKEELARAHIQHQEQQKQISLRTTLAYVLGVGILILIFGLAAAYHNFKQRRLIDELNYQNELQDRQEEMKIKAMSDKFQALNNERNRIASDLHDDIGAGLSSIHIYSTIFAAQTDKSANSGLIEKINRVSAGLLDRMSDIIWSINSENRTIRDLLLRVKSFANELLPTLDIELNYTVENDLEEIHLTDLARKNLYLTFKEALNNIAKYSHADTVNFRFIKVDNSLQATISDDGWGFDIPTATNGNGLKTMASRTENLGGVFRIESTAGSGTRIDITIPFNPIIEKNLTDLQSIIE